MNTLESYSIANPENVTDECAKIVIDDPASAFILSDIMQPGVQYTFGFWIKSDVDSIVKIAGSSFASATSWQKHAITFTASGKNFAIRFLNSNTYYIYHPKLEIGNKATDWSPAPEDVELGISNASDMAAAAQKTADVNTDRVNIAESTITQLADSIAMLVRDENGASLMTQTETGWSFDISKITSSLDNATSSIQTLTESLGGVDNTVKALDQAVNDLGVLTDYVVITTYNGQPCIELGESENDFKLRITNTAIQFVEGSSLPAYINNQKLMIEQAEVKNELAFGGFVWKIRDNGNMGIIWKGVSS